MERRTAPSMGEGVRTHLDGDPDQRRSCPASRTASRRANGGALAAAVGRARTSAGRSATTPPTSPRTGAGSRPRPASPSRACGRSTARASSALGAAAPPVRRPTRSCRRRRRGGGVRLRRRLRPGAARRSRDRRGRRGPRRAGAARSRAPRPRRCAPSRARRARPPVGSWPRSARPSGRAATRSRRSSPARFAAEIGPDGRPGERRAARPLGGERARPRARRWLAERIDVLAALHLLRAGASSRTAATRARTGRQVAFIAPRRGRTSRMRAGRAGDPSLTGTA